MLNFSFIKIISVCLLLASGTAQQYLTPNEVQDFLATGPEFDWRILTSNEAKAEIKLISRPDLNLDKKLDYVFSGPVPFSLVSTPEGDYVLYPMNEFNPETFEAAWKGSGIFTWRIETYRDLYRYDKKIEKRPEFMYGAGGFIEASIAKSEEAIAALDFEAESCFGKCPVYEVKLHDTGLVKFHGRQFTRIIGRSECQIKPDDYQDLVRILNAINFKMLKDKYSAILTDQETVTLKIYYGKKKQKVIVDYGRRGPHGIRLIYRKLDSIMRFCKFA